MEKSKLLMIIIIALLVLLLGTIVGVSMYALRLFNEVGTGDGSGVASGPQVVRILNREDISIVSLGDPITTNLQSGADGRARFAVVSVNVGYDNSVRNESDAFGQLLESQIPLARSVALRCLYGKTFDELRDPDGIAELENEILEMLQQEFNTSLIVEVTLSDYTFQ